MEELASRFARDGFLSQIFYKIWASDYRVQRLAALEIRATMSPATANGKPIKNKAKMDQAMADQSLMKSKCYASDRFIQQKQGEAVPLKTLQLI